MKNIALAALVAACVSGSALAAPVGWDAFIIRNASGSGDAPIVNETATSAEFILTQGGQKAGLGSSNLDGATLSQIGTLSISRDDDNTVYSPATGAYYAPYMNIWVTDGNGNHGVLANEPSNVEWTGESEWDTDWTNMSTKTAKVFEKSASFVLPTATGPGGQFLFSDFAAYVISAPSAAYLTTPGNGNGGGAPRQLGTNLTYGFNWIFGDTLANYVSGQDGYMVSSPVATIAAVPLPSAGLAGLALMAGILSRRNRTA